MTNFKWSLGPVPTATFLLVLGILAGNCFVLHRNSVSLHSAQDVVNGIYEKLMRSQALALSLKDAETDARSFVMTGDESYSEDFTQLASVVVDNVQRWRNAAEDNPDQIARISAISELVNKRLAFLESAIAKRAANEKNAAIDQVMNRGGNDERTKIRQTIEELQAEDYRGLSERSIEQDSSLSVLLTANLITFALGAIVIVLGWYLVERELQMRRMAEATAHLERQNLLVTLTSIGDGVIVVDDQARVKLVNPVAMQLLGNPHAVVGKPLSIIFPMVNEKTREPVEHPVQQILTKGRYPGFAAHTMLIRTDGVEIPIEQSAAPIHDSSGNIIGVVFVFRDCSERQRYEREMREREGRFRRVFETPLIGIAIGSSQGTIVEANDAFLDMIGYRRNDLQKMELSWEGMPSGRSPLDEAAQLELREDGVCRPFERIFSRADGTRVPVLISASRLSNDQDQIVVFVTDLTQSKRAEAALRESETRFRVLSECMPQMVWTTLPDGQLDYLNQTFLEYAKLHRDQYPETIWEHLVHPDDVAVQLEKWRRSLVTGEMFEMELRVRNPQGEYRWHLSRALPVHQADNRITMWVGTNTDIHDQKQAEEALREEHHRKDEFLALLAHELRNPLAPLSNAVQVFQSAHVDAETSATLLGIMQRQIRLLTRLIDDLLDLARITTGKMRLRCERISVKTVVSGAIEAIQPFIHERKHDLAVVVPDEELWIDADSARITQILTNLLHNAAKYTSVGGKLSLTVDQNNSSVVLKIRDNGPGISPVMLSKIFDLFTQSEKTLDRSEGGLGIGLALVRTLVELHGGLVRASSEGLSKGSEFVVELPLAEPASTTQTTSDGGTTGRNQKLPKLRILVVDDVQASAKTLALMLKTLDQDVDVRFDGASALARVTEADFQLMFVDIAMPGMNGLEVARRIRENPALKNLKLVALTGFGQDIDRANSLEAGFNEHLTKPTSLDDLTKIIRETGGSTPENSAAHDLKV